MTKNENRENQKLKETNWKFKENTIIQIIQISIFMKKTTVEETIYLYVRNLIFFWILLSSIL